MDTHHTGRVPLSKFYGSALDSEWRFGESETYLRDQLEKIAATHDGLVPLHGRLFAQWLHYAFPHDCPFPHKAGATAKLTPGEYGDQHLAQSEDMRRHAEEANSSDIPITVGRDDLQWMSQWSPEEELVSDQAMRSFHTSWDGKRYAAGGAALVLLAGLLGFLSSKGKSSTNAEDLLFAQTKSHFV